MPYKISIVELTTEKSTYVEWRPLKERPVTDEEYSKMNYYSQGAAKDSVKEGIVPMVKESGYVNVDKIEQKETKILEQTVDSIDLKKIIAAINQL